MFLQHFPHDIGAEVEILMQPLDIIFISMENLNLPLIRHELPHEMPDNGGIKPVILDLLVLRIEMTEGIDDEDRIAPEDLDGADEVLLL